MSRGMTPAILAMMEERARDKLRCVLKLRERTLRQSRVAQPSRLPLS